MILPDGKTVRYKELYENCPIQMYEHEFLTGLYRFELTDFGVIMGMDWLAKYQAQIDCPRSRITLRGPIGEKVVHKGKGLRAQVKLIFMMKARKLLTRGSKGFLCNVIKIEDTKSSLEDIPVVREFPDVFPEEIPCMPSLREVEFNIGLTLGATLISKAPYRMALT